MKIPERSNQHVADLHWLAFLLTGCCETSVDVVIETIASQDAEQPFVSTWMRTWSRRLVIANALSAVHESLDASALRAETARVDKAALPARDWTLAEGTTKLQLERALLAIDLFPRAAVLLLVFEGMRVGDAAVLLDADPDLVRKAQVIGLQELTLNLARMRHWTPRLTKSDATSGVEYA